VFQAQHLPSAELNQLGAKKAQESSLPDVLNGSRSKPPKNVKERKDASKAASANPNLADPGTPTAKEEAPHAPNQDVILENLNSIIFETISRADAQASTTETASFSTMTLE
jgi:hypothetical protein